MNYKIIYVNGLVLLIASDLSDGVQVTPMTGTVFTGGSY